MAANSQIQQQQKMSKTVELESWPAQPLKQAPSSLSLAAEKTGARAPASVAPPPAPKPKFLQQLEAYLVKELRLLGCPPSGPHELRLQAHREVFEYLIEDFKTYKPLLSAIKTEYELFITHLQEQIADLEPLTAEMEVVREECERQLLAIAQQEKRAESDVEMENKRLIAIIDSLRSKEKDYQRQVERLQEEVGSLYQQFRDEADARKLLVADYNELKLQQAEGGGEGMEVAGKGDEREDPTVLKLKLARAREDLRLANQRITGIMADYSDVVPRTEFERMESAYKALEVEHEMVKNDHTALMTEHRTLQEVHQGVVAERDRLSSSLTRLRGTATPRPDWSRCQGYVEEWEESSRGRSSDQLVDLLLARLSGKTLDEITALSGFQAQGLGEEVPRYLRWEGRVPNHRFSQSQVNSLVTGFWKHALTSDLSSLVVEESLWEYLLSLNSGNEQKAVEDAYNLQDAASRLSHEPHVALFSQVLSGEMRLEAVQQWMTAQTNLTQAYTLRQDSEGFLSGDAVSGGVRAAFPSKTPARLASLVSCATAGRDRVKLAHMLSPEESGRPSELALLLLQQQTEETGELLALLQSALPDSSDLTMAELETAITNIEPTYPASLLHSLLTPLYSDPGVSLPLPQITSHLAACGFTKHSPHTS